MSIVVSNALAVDACVGVQCFTKDFAKAIHVYMLRVSLVVSYYAQSSE